MVEFRVFFSYGESSILGLAALPNYENDKAKGTCIQAYKKKTPK